MGEGMDFLYFEFANSWLEFRKLFLTVAICGLFGYALMRLINVYGEKKDKYIKNTGLIYNFIEGVILYPLCWLSITLLGGFTLGGLIMLAFSLLSLIFCKYC